MYRVSKFGSRQHGHLLGRNRPQKHAPPSCGLVCRIWPMLVNGTSVRMEIRPEMGPSGSALTVIESDYELMTSYLRFIEL